MAKRTANISRKTGAINWIWSALAVAAAAGWWAAWPQPADAPAVEATAADEAQAAPLPAVRAPAPPASLPAPAATVIAKASAPRARKAAATRPATNPSLPVSAVAPRKGGLFGELVLAKWHGDRGAFDDAKQKLRQRIGQFWRDNSAALPPEAVAVAVRDEDPPPPPADPPADDPPPADPPSEDAADGAAPPAAADDSDGEDDAAQADAGDDESDDGEDDDDGPDPNLGGALQTAVPATGGATTLERPER